MSGADHGQASAVTGTRNKHTPAQIALGHSFTVYADQ
jgi:hypothetical protein